VLRDELPAFSKGHQAGQLVNGRGTRSLGNGP
jgi:hypothetical protein